MIKKLTKLTKTLLVAAGLCVGATSAWADTTLGTGTLGNTDFTTAFNTTYSDAVSIPENNTATITFVNHSNKTSNYANWAVALSNDVAHGGTGYLEYVYLRADSWFWSPSYDKNTPFWYTSFSDNYPYGGNGDPEFRNALDGATVTLTITRKGAMVNIHAVAAKESTEYYEDLSLFCGTGTQTIRAYMTCQEAYLTNLNYSVAATAGSSNDAGWATCNANIDFSNAISDGTVVGEKGSMVITNSTRGGSETLPLAISDGSIKLDGETTPVAGRLLVGYGNGTVTIAENERAGYGRAANRDVVTMTFGIAFGNLSNKYTGFTVKDASGNTIAQMRYRRYGSTFDGTNSFGLETADIKTGGANGGNWDNVCIFKLTFDYQNATMSCLTNNMNQAKSVAMSNTNPIAQFIIESNGETAGRRSLFDDLLIYTTTGDYSISDVGYTVKFVDGENVTVKDDDTSRKAVPGTEISLLATASDQATFYNDGFIANNNTTEFPTATNKYVYKSISAVNSSLEAIDELEDGAIITVVYDKYNKYDYEIKQKLGTTDATSVQSGTKWDDETVTYYYPVCVKDGDDHYTTTANSETPWYGLTVTKDNATPVINYTLDSDIVYYAETEDILTEGSTSIYFPSYSSKGSSMALVAAQSSTAAIKTTMSNAVDGLYDITIASGDRYGSGTNYTLQLIDGNDATNDFVTVSLGKSEYKVSEFKGKNIPAGSEIYHLVDNTGNADSKTTTRYTIDYIIIRKAPSVVTATVGTTGYATFSSDYALDFTPENGVTGVAAYYASAASDGKVSMTKVTGTVAPKTGLFLAKDGYSDVSIPVVASGTDISGSNLLVATNGTDVAAGNYVFAKQGEDYGFYKLGTNTAVSAGKAYLKSNALARTLGIVFDDEATGIKTIQGEEFLVDGYYNLSGQRVAQPSKGLYIVNGKKVIMK